MLLQIGPQEHPELTKMGAPPLWKFIKTEENRKVAELIVSQQNFQRPYFVAKETPPELVAILRTAFDATMKDPQFLADAAKVHIDVSPLPGARVQQLIGAFFSTPQSVVEGARQQIWGERAGVPVMTAPQGSDPASLAFDAMARAEAEGADLLLIDTAGRLQNREDLMAELAKIVRVIRKRDPYAPHNTLLVLDATTGQNALNQVEIFQKIADVSGLVMTKLDGTAKGGVLVALADRFGLPIHAIGVGESIDDLAPFDPEDFARALTGL
jgi:hypothetical protein